MDTYYYKVTLKSGIFSFVPNGIELDRIVRERGYDIASIELVTEISC